MGFAVMALVAFRVLWGFMGGSTARFAQFVRGPRTVLAYLLGRARRSVGHNPAGGWSVMALLFTTLAVTGLGLFASDREGEESGPFADWVPRAYGRLVTRLHGWAFYLLLALIAAHLTAIAVYALRGENLLGPMVSGRAPLAEEESLRPAGVMAWLAALGVAVALLVLLLWADAR
jgi:cytochrome b